MGYQQQSVSCYRRLHDDLIKRGEDRGRSSPLFAQPAANHAGPSPRRLLRRSESQIIPILMHRHH